jgi:CHAT domain-containing protein
MPGLAAEAAYAFVRARRPGEAAVALEAARFRAGSEALALVRADLDALTEVHADLAARLRRAAAGWRAASHRADEPLPVASSVSLSFSPTTLHDIAAGAALEPPQAADERQVAVEAALDAKRAEWESAARATGGARDEFEAAVREIRAVPGFESFLTTPSEEDVRSLGDRVPLVYLTAAHHGGVAIAYAPGRAPHAAVLEALTVSALEAEVAKFQEAYAASDTDPERWRSQLDETTRWLWDAAMARVLRLAGGWRRLALVPTRTLGLLPLHAAWRPDARAPTGRRYVCDRAVIGYLPNARSASATVTADDSALVAIADPAPLPEGLPPVAFAGPEVAAAAAWHPNAVVLPERQASRANVLAALPSASVYHFACHGRVDLDEPRRSALVLAHGDLLTLQDFLNLHLEQRAGGRLAILTACDTALAGMELPDEVISLPGALLQAGLTGVVATLWAVEGLPAAFLAARFYGHLKGDGWDPATSLVAAQRWLRDSTDSEKAAYVHPRNATSPLPVDARRTLWRAVVTRDPAGRSFADISDWGAYAFIGQPDKT